MRTVHVVTHPEATHHVTGLVGGWYDSSLTRRGTRDAAAIADALRARISEGARVELYSSDLTRAVQTATVIGRRLGVAAVLDPRLREKSYGEAEGRPQAWLDERFVPPPLAGDRLTHDEGVAGAETKAAFADRAYAAMHAVVGSTADDQVIVTHGFTVTFLVAAWIGMPVESTGYVSLRAEPGSVTTLREDDLFHNRQIVSVGDDGHLRP